VNKPQVTNCYRAFGCILAHRLLSTGQCQQYACQTKLFGLLFNFCHLVSIQRSYFQWYRCQVMSFISRVILCLSAVDFVVAERLT